MTDDDYKLVLYARGWCEVPSHCVVPKGAGAHWQRWEGPGEYDWVEMPRSYSIGFVFQNIHEMSFPKKPR